MQNSPRPDLTWTAFLVATIGVVGLVGLFATYAAPLTYQRELRLQAVLDQLPAIPPSQWPALRDQLGDSAHAILDTPGPAAPRIAAEQHAMNIRLARQAAAELSQLRLLIIVVTVMAALFGAVLMRLQSRA